MITRRSALAAGLALTAAPAFALDAGTASGRYDDGDTRFTVSHAIALAMDNAEGFQESEGGLRVLLSDREVPVSAICGLAFPPVWGMARAGTLKGLLLKFDPADRTGLVATVLATPEQGFSLASLTVSSSAGLWSRLEANATRIVGALKPDASEKMSFDFSAPVFTNAVEADLKGPTAQGSEPVKVLIARAEAIGRGDMKGAAALSTPSAGESLLAAPPEMLKVAPKLAAELIRHLKSARRVVVRRETAAVMLGPGEWASVAKVDGVWKAAD